jgi:UDP-2-acetamido-3-amino-2,3-dideoxy-glucuronate N-acetyltransferase
MKNKEHLTHDTLIINDYFTHDTATIDGGAKIGSGTKVWHYTHICDGAEVGKNCVLGQNVYIGPGVKIGNNVKIQNNVSVYEGVIIEDDVFLGPSCVLTNDKYPSASGEWKLVKTHLKKGSSVGANATIVCGVVLEEGAMVGAGAVVTKDVSKGVVVVGNPAKELYKKKSVGVVGCGIVGGAIVSALNKSGEYSVIMNDKYKEGDEYRPIDALKECDFVFISVPTPFDEERGEVNLEPVISSSLALRDSGFKGILIIKSTIPPATTRAIQAECPDMTVVFNPEFLRAKTAVKDFYNQKNIIFGVNNSWNSEEYEQICEVFSHIINHFSEDMVTCTEYETAELIKYSQNIMFASRVAICNIIYDACKENNVDYNKVKELAFYNEPTIGKHVVEVPGPDGLRGFGGVCLPKDLAGFNGFHPNKILAAILEYNKKLGRKIE